MKNKIEILSRKAAERLIAKGFPEKTAVISFYDPKSKRTSKDYTPIDYSKVCDRVFHVAIHDIDIEILPDFGFTYETYFPEADELARFIIKSISEGYSIICQCEYGQSRSAACAAAIKEFYNRNGIEIFADYRYYPNQLIFNKMLEALKNEKKRNELFHDIQKINRHSIYEKNDCKQRANGSYSLLSHPETDEKEIVVPNGISEIYEFAFAKCPNMRKVTLPKSVEYIDSSAFENCKSLLEVVFEDTEGWYYVSNDGWESETEILPRHLESPNIAAVMLTEAHENSWRWEKRKDEKLDKPPEIEVY